MIQFRSNKHIQSQKKGKKDFGGRCIICETKKNIEGHHIIGVDEGGPALEENIMPLCKKHHRGKGIGIHYSKEISLMKMSGDIEIEVY